MSETAEALGRKTAEGLFAITYSGLADGKLAAQRDIALAITSNQVQAN